MKTRNVARVIMVAASAVLGGLSVGEAHAQDYPNRLVRIVVPYAPGGPSDLLVRIIAPKLADGLGQPVIVDNRPGASGNLGTDLVAKAAPDGYTLVIGTNTTAANATLFKNMPFDILRDFAPITTLFRDGNMLVVPASLPVNSVGDLIAMARAKPGTLNFASSGNGTSTHLAGVLFNQTANINLTHIPYKGIAQGIADVLGGQVTMMFTSIAVVSPQVKAGKLKALGVTRKARLANFPDVPTLAEAGLAGFELTNGWGGLWAPAGTARPIVMKLHNETVKILRMPDIREAFESRSVEPGGDTPEEFYQSIKSDIEKLAVIIKASGATLD